VNEDPAWFRRWISQEISSAKLEKYNDEKSAFLLLAATPLELPRAINDTILLLRSLGFTIHDTKSATTPTQVVNFLGFTLNSPNMTTSMVTGKADTDKIQVSRFCHERLAREIG